MCTQSNLSVFINLKFLCILGVFNQNILSVSRKNVLNIILLISPSDYTSKRYFFFPQKNVQMATSKKFCKNEMMNVKCNSSWVQNSYHILIHFSQEVIKKQGKRQYEASYSAVFYKNSNIRNRNDIFFFIHFLK